VFDRFKQSKKLRMLLYKLQQQENSLSNNNAQPLQMLYYNATRWWSKYVAIKRLIELKQFIKLIVDSEDRFKLNVYERSALAECKEETFWEKLSHILEMMAIFKKATNLIESDTANYLMLLDAMNGIEKFINNWNLKDKFNCDEIIERKFKEDVKIITKKRQSQYLEAKDHHAYNSAKLLTDQLEGHSAKSATTWLKGWGSDLILLYQSKFRSTFNKTKEEIKDILHQQLNNFHSCEEEFDDKNDIKRACSINISEDSFYYDKNNPDNKMVDWVKFWKHYLTFVPELANIAYIILNLGISEAMCERSFSLQKLTHNVLRNRLSPSTIEAEMRYRYNKKVLSLSDIDDVEGDNCSDFD
jgi:hypothetical protein